MASEGTGAKTQIVIAVIGLIGALGGALLANWDKIITPKPRVIAPAVDPTEPPLPPRTESVENKDSYDTVNIPTADFPGGTRKVYSADFTTWPRYESEYGSITLGHANSYVVSPNSNTYLGPSRQFGITPLDGDFVFELRFRIAESHPSSLLTFSLIGGGEDADTIDVRFFVNNSDAFFGLAKGRLRIVDGGLFHVTEETIKEHEQLQRNLTNHNWSQPSKITLKREAGNMKFFVNDIFIKDFNVSLFSLQKMSISSAHKSKIVITSIEARVRG